MSPEQPDGDGADRPDTEGDAAPVPDEPSTDPTSSSPPDTEDVDGVHVIVDP